MEFDVVPAPGDGVYFLRRGGELKSWKLGDGGGFLVGLLVRGGELNGNVGLLEGGNLVVFGFPGIGFVSGAVAQVKVQRVGAFPDQDALLSEGNAGGAVNADAA